MSIDSQGALFAALGNGSFGLVVGTLETEWLEFKRQPYRLETLKDKWALAKDVVAFANARGGCIVIGFETKRETHEIADRAIAHRPVPRDHVDPDQYVKVIERWCYPLVRAIRAHWFPPDEDAGVFVLEIPPQDDRDRYFMTTRIVDDDDREREAILVPRREGARNPLLPAGELHRLVVDGLRSASQGAAALPASAQDATEAVVGLEALQGWSDVATYFLRASPQDQDRLEHFLDSEGPRDALQHMDSLRPTGFSLRAPGVIRVIEGNLAYLEDARKAILVDYRGPVTVGCKADESFLGWGMETVIPEPGAPRQLLNPVAVVELTLEFFRFVVNHVMPFAHRKHGWTVHVICRRFRAHGLALFPGLPGPVLPFASTIASSDAWDRSVDMVGNPGRDAFRALAEFYALFGIPPNRIPFAKGDEISEDEVRSVT